MGPLLPVDELPDLGAVRTGNDPDLAQESRGDFDVGTGFVALITGVIDVGEVAVDGRGPVPVTLGIAYGECLR